MAETANFWTLYWAAKKAGWFSRLNVKGEKAGVMRLATDADMKTGRKMETTKGGMFVVSEGWKTACVEDGLVAPETVKGMSANGKADHPALVLARAAGWINRSVGERYEMMRAAKEGEEPDTYDDALGFVVTAIGYRGACERDSLELPYYLNPQIEGLEGKRVASVATLQKPGKSKVFVITDESGKEYVVKAARKPDET